MGPLIKKSGQHYFSNSFNGKIVYLTGSHTWNNFQDYGKSDPPPVFDFDAHLKWLDKFGHNFIRLWVFEQTKGDAYHSDIWIEPHPYERTGPGTALDGKLKFDLRVFNQQYFDRLRSRAVKARHKGIYVSVMLFQGWSISANYGKHLNPWKGHPFNKNNNVDGIDGDFYDKNGEGEEYHSTLSPAILKFQKAYIRKVVDTLNDLDNVLYEISNEDPGREKFWAEKHKEWQYELVDFIREYERTKPKQHPIGITTTRALGNDFVFNSRADWISTAPTANNTCEDDPYKTNPPVPGTDKVILLDTDHLWGIGGGSDWVWKSFLRGYNPIYMDTLKDSFTKRCQDKTYNFDLVEARRNMGYTLQYAKKIDLSDMKPLADITSTDFCLAKEGEKYIAYQPSNSKPLTVSNVPPGQYTLETLDVKDGSTNTLRSLVWGGGDIYIYKPVHVKKDWVAVLIKENG